MFEIFPPFSIVALFVFPGFFCESCSTPRYLHLSIRRQRQMGIRDRLHLLPILLPLLCPSGPGWPPGGAEARRPRHALRHGGGAGAGLQHVCADHQKGESYVWGRDDGRLDASMDSLLWEVLRSLSVP